VIVVDGQIYLHIHPNHRLSGNVALRDDPLTLRPIVARGFSTSARSRASR
jgi:hypothetical protein